jgi:hypothetical protein
MCVLFFQGCERGGIALTMGPVTPYLCVIYDSDHPQRSQWVEFSVGRALVNLAVLGCGLVALPRWWPRLAPLVCSRRFQGSAMLVAIVFNLVLVAESLWVNLVFHPISLICDVLDKCLGIAESWRTLTVAAVARLYFVFCWLAAYGFASLVLVVAERYLGFDRRRWWQYNLRLLLAVTFVVGTGLGIALRLRG